MDTILGLILLVVYLIFKKLQLRLFIQFIMIFLFGVVLVALQDRSLFTPVGLVIVYGILALRIR